MGVSINAQDFKDSEYVNSVKDMCRIIVERSFSPIEMFDISYKFTKNYQTEKKVLKILHNNTNSVINQRREQLKKKNEAMEKEDDFGVKKKMAFLDMLLQATVDGRPLTNEDVREEVDTFMFEVLNQYLTLACINQRYTVGSNCCNLGNSY